MNLYTFKLIACPNFSDSKLTHPWAYSLEGIDLSIIIKISKILCKVFCKNCLFFEIDKPVLTPIY